MTGIWLVSYLVLWVIVIILAIVVVSILHHIGTIYTKIEQRQPPPTKLKVGDLLPNVVLQTPDGNKVSVSQFTGIKTAFLIISPGCSSCNEALMITKENNLEQPSNQNMVVLSLRDISATLDMVKKAQLPSSYPILVDTNDILQNAWGIHMTPILVEADEELKMIQQTVFIGSNTS